MTLDAGITAGLRSEHARGQRERREGVIDFTGEWSPGIQAAHRATLAAAIGVPNRDVDWGLFPAAPARGRGAGEASGPAPARGGAR